jgi:acetolactate synthase-1/2/3 large subunit
MKRNGAKIMWEMLMSEGVEVVFGYPGGAVLPIYDAMLEYPVHHVLARHEQGAAHMADGYARASGKVGVALATSGPGASNLVTGIATAMMDSSPIVCITGQVPSFSVGSDAFQELDVTGVTLPITKHNYLVTRAEDIGPVIREAFHIARSGRPGPVLIDISKDAQQAVVDFEFDDAAVQIPGYRPDPRALPETYQRALDLIQEAERPIVLAGHGVLMSGAMEALQAFIELTQTPVATTLLGLGCLPDDHRLNLGMMGMHGDAWVNTAVQEADLLLACGMRFDDRVTGKLETFAPGAKKIHIDIDPSEINKVVKADVGIVGDLDGVLKDLLPRLSPMERDSWLCYIEALREDSAARDIMHLPYGECLSAPHVIHDLWRCTSGDATIVCDVGQHQMWTAQYYRHEAPYKLITSGGLGTMGFALPAAIGAWFANPEAQIWVIVGDGGFQMSAAELTTCVQEGVKLNIAIINNGYLGMVRQWQEMFYERRYAATPIIGPDFVKLADAHGIPARRVEQREQVEDAVRAAQSEPGTFVIDFRVEQEDNVYPLVAAGADLTDMIRRPAPQMEIAGELS